MMTFLKQINTSVRIGLVFLIGIFIAVGLFSSNTNETRSPIYELSIDQLGSNIYIIGFILFIVLPIGAFITYVFLNTAKGGELIKKRSFLVVPIFLFSVAFAFVAEIYFDVYTGWGYDRVSGYISRFYLPSYFCGQTRIASAAEGVVKIETESSKGSGFWLTDNLVLTDGGTVNHKENIKVIDGDQNQYLADIVQTDTSWNLSLLKIRSPMNYGDHKILKWRLHPSDLGESVFVLVFPKDAKDTRDGVLVTKGIVSALVRDEGAGLIVTDALIDSNGYGSPMIDVCGKVIGVVIPTPYDISNPSVAVEGMGMHDKLSEMIVASENVDLNEIKNDETATLEEYYSMLDKGDFKNAYNFYSEDLKSRVLFKGWAESYNNSFVIEVKSIEKIFPGFMSISFATIDSFGDGKGEVIKEFKGTWSLVKEKGLWKLDFSNIRELSSKTNFNY